ncbi:GntR family transcriptional regulator [Bacillus weihaiensis]|uniref:GntR family transcriptional regulator n=1 Tax=Bacillus weihaiensis TaxID=1547283 RepID=A0A1L3MMA0_9BACI|nr:GntR family transcriptional regulator [Bacillus weihaiensis]APH03432.1 GntR family transcriptional regulator [Bacillus weihaiensis]
MERTIDSSKNVALYLQVKDILINRIQDKTWLPNTLIPTEQELMEEFDVSRTTLRQAISILVQDGLLEKKQGKGTIVKSQQLAGNGRLKGFAEEVTEKGLTPNSKLLRIEFKKDLYHEKSKLDVPDDEEILVIERIRFADQVPIAIERTCWPAHIGKLFRDIDLDSAKFYEILEANDIILKRAHEKISAINATLFEADLLGIRGGEAMLETERLSFGLDDRPVEFSKIKFRSDKYHYNIELTR